MTNLFKEFLLKIVSLQLRDSISQKARVLLYDNVTGCKIMRRARFWRPSIRPLCAVVGLWYHTTQPYSRTERMTDLQKQSQSFLRNAKTFWDFKKHDRDATFAHKASTCAFHRKSSEIFIPNSLKHITVSSTFPSMQNDSGGFSERNQESFLSSF